MKKKQTLTMPLENVKKTLSYISLDYAEEKLPNGGCTQLWLIVDGFDHVNINTFETGTVVVQPYDDPAATFVASVLALRAKKLLRKGKIRPR